jgi:hypothetical protein
MRTRIQRWIRIPAVVVLLSVIAIGVPAIRWHILRSAGWALVLRQAPAKSADVIVVAVDADGAGTLEAADLVHNGVSTRVAVFADPPDPIVDVEFLHRGIPYEDAAAVSIRQLRSLGIDNIEQIARTVAGSEEEGDVLPAWCDQHQYRSVVVVTTSDHSRRLGRVLRRSMQGHQTSVTVQPAHYSKFDPDRWWLTRGGTRTEIFELEKLLLDLVRHPFS